MDQKTKLDTVQGDVAKFPGYLFGMETQRAVDNFPISGLTMPEPFIRALGLVKYACARVNGKLEVLETSLCEAIADAAWEVAEGHHSNQFPVDVFQTGSGTSTNMNANEVIAKLAARKTLFTVHPNDHVNYGQSSNDVIPTAIHVSAAIAINNELLPALEQLTKAIDSKSQQIPKTVKTGRTHLMDAMPLTVQQEWSAWVQQLRNNNRRICGTLKRLNELAIGATAVGTGVNAPPKFGEDVAALLHRETGITFVTKPNAFEGLASQDTAVEVSGALKTLAVSLMKIANDLRWMNSGPHAGLGEIKLPKLQAGSSIMPGKVNPVIPEAVCMVAAQVIGNDTTITVAGQSGNFQLNVMLPVIAYNLLQSISLLTHSCELLAKNFEGIELQESRLETTVKQNPTLVTALNSLIGYDTGAEIVKRATEEGRALIDVAREMTDIDDATLERLLDPSRLVSSRVHE